RAYEDSQGHLLSFLSAFLNRTDEVRKASIILKNSNPENAEREIVRILKMEHFSENRKRFVLGRLRRESHLFTQEVLEYVYSFIIELNIRAKSSPIKDEKNLYFLEKMEKLFMMLSN
ncbi:MAG: hypothetical protein KDK36_14985, partial [Leptospiraceae bacterium]|nr:hypothetical protein [Leptospiraceae bacterium]